VLGAHIAETGGAEPDGGDFGAMGGQPGREWHCGMLDSDWNRTVINAKRPGCRARPLQELGFRNQASG
jgi:hypothetical protein